MSTHASATAQTTDPSTTYLNAKEVFVRFGWKKTFGYDMLKVEGFPTPIGTRYRLDSLLQWELRVLAGELSGRPPRKPKQLASKDIDTEQQAIKHEAVNEKVEETFSLGKRRQTRRNQSKDAA
ncbi:hypothetical protein GCM10009798_34720 [Nocardioides panacihumi]|uniref:DNA-binding protein n=1 Tax=Nocardioides panacihumi TaxID=400774 RepID=A0ABN2RM06_9ACTN